MSTPNVPGAPRRRNSVPPPPKPARAPRIAPQRASGRGKSPGSSPAGGGRTRREQRARRRRRPLFLIGAIVAVGLIIWGIAALAGTGKKPTVDSTAYVKGDCFADFDAAAASGNKVDCTEPHSAQLVGVENAGADEKYPGRDALEQRSGELCKASNIALPNNTGNLKQRSAYPSQDGWTGGDRRMDCYIVTTDGNTITASFLK